jgi:hypothetical protein
MHRCPGWAGGGLRYAKVSRCDDGRLVGGRDGTLFEGRFWWLRFNRCDTCDVLVLPYAVRYVDPRWLAWEVRWTFEKLGYRIEERRERRRRRDAE